MKSKKLLSFLLATAMTIPLLPTFTLTILAKTTTTEKNITLGTAALSGYDSTNGYKYVYYGKYGTDAIKWRILSKNGNGGTYKDNKDNGVATENAMFLLSDLLYGTENNGKIYFQQGSHSDNGMYYKDRPHSSNDHTNCRLMNEWQDSDAQKWCNSFYNNNLTLQEQGAVLATTKNDSAYGIYASCDKILSDDKVFFLSAEEVSNAAYGFTDYNARIAYYDNGRGVWWLRSPDARKTYNVSSVNGYGYVNDSDAGDIWAARHAFNLNTLSVLFTSAAVGGKSSTAVSGETVIFENVNLSTLTGNDGYKLTMLDDSRKFKIKDPDNEEATSICKNALKGGTVKLKYENAKTKTETSKDEYISAMIVDKTSREVLYYGQLEAAQSGKIEIDFNVPTDIDCGTYELCFFNEQINGDKMTDYSSEFQTVTLNVLKETPTVSDFSFTEPSYLIYNGHAKEARVTSNKSGMGTIRIKYYQGEDEVQPINAGAYTVKIDVDEGNNYAGATNIEVGTFTITKKTINAEITLAAPVKYATPQTRIDTDEYTATVVWSPMIAVNDTFAASTKYTATITVTPNSNYTVAGLLESNCKLDGADSVTLDSIENGNAVITASFPETAGSSDSGIRYYTVNFNTNGGKKITAQIVSSGGKAKEPEKPTKEGYIFDGWYSASELITEYDFNTKVTKNITVYAKWVEDEVQEPSDDQKDDNNNDEQKPQSDEWKNPFDDVSTSNWFFEYVKYVNENGLMNGTTNSEFSPNLTLTRGMLVTILYRLAGEPAVNKSIPFADVSADSYYRDSVIWAQQNGIVLGISETQFAPDENITREQIAVIFYRYAKFMEYDISIGENTNILSYTDFDEISEYAIEAMQYAVGSGLMEGKTEDTLNPKDNATRAETAAIIKRFIECNK